MWTLLPSFLISQPSTLPVLHNNSLYLLLLSCIHDRFYALGLGWDSLVRDTQCLLSCVIIDRSKDSSGPLGEDSWKLCIWDPCPFPRIPPPSWGHLEGSQWMLHTMALKHSLRTWTCELSPSILENKHACPENSNLSCLNTNLPFALEGVLPVFPKFICYRREVIWSEVKISQSCLALQPCGLYVRCQTLLYMEFSRLQY